MDDDDEGFPAWGPFWTPAERTALQRGFERAFPVTRLPEGAELVLDPQDDDSTIIAKLCRGKTWREVDAAALLQMLSFGSFTTDVGFCALVPAFIYQSIVADAEHRFEIESSLVDSLEYTRADSRPYRDEHRATVARRVARFTPAQCWVVRELLRMVHRRATPPLAESEDGRFWDSIDATDAPSIMCA